MTPSHKAKDGINVNEELIEELERLFPKGDKARGKALVLNALAQIKISDLEKENKDLRDDVSNCLKYIYSTMDGHDEILWEKIEKIIAKYKLNEVNEK